MDATKTPKIKTATAEQIAAWSAKNANMAIFYNETIPQMHDQRLAASLSNYSPGHPGNANTRTRRNHAVMVAEATRRGWTTEQIEAAVRAA